MIFSMIYLHVHCRLLHKSFLHRALCGGLRFVCVHTVNFCLEMVQAKHVSGKNTFYSTNKDKIGEERIFEIVHCPFEG